MTPINNLQDYNKVAPELVAKLKRDGLLVEFCNRMGWEPPKEHSKHTQWTDERLFESAKKCSSRGEWFKTDKKAYQSAQQRGILPQIYQELGWPPPKVKLRWTDELLLKSAKTCSSSGEWMKADRNAYATAARSDRLSKICEELGWPPPQDKSSYVQWTDERLFESAKKCASSSEWRKTDRKAYATARHKHLLPKIRAELGWPPPAQRAPRQK